MIGSKPTLILACLVSLSLNAAISLSANDSPVAIGGEAQIFVDDAFIARRTGVTRTVHPCQKLDAPVMVSQEPWESDGIDRRIYVYGTVMQDSPEGPFRMWYNRLQFVLHATSQDGLHWKRPSLRRYEVNGNKTNNIVFSGFHSPSVVHNPLEVSPEKRYQMLGYSQVNGRGYYAAHSADGLHWQLYPKNPVLPSGDTCTLAFDARTGEYLAFHKQTREHRGQRRRLVYLATSRDMQQWSDPELVLAPDEQDDRFVAAEGGRFSQFYNLSVFPWGGQFLGLVTHFRYFGPPTERGPLQSGDDGPIDVQLVHSRDGRRWDRCEDRSPVIPLGPHVYDAGCILGVTNGPLLVEDEMWFYYTAITTTHAGYVPEKQITIGLAKWRTDGLVSFSAGAEGGLIETVPLRHTGERLIVNADAASGELAVSVLDASGDELAGFGVEDCDVIRTDSVRHEVRWRGRSQLPERQPIRLRFRLKDTRLYSYRL